MCRTRVYAGDGSVDGAGGFEGIVDFGGGFLESGFGLLDGLATFLGDVFGFLLEFGSGLLGIGSVVGAARAGATDQGDGE